MQTYAFELWTEELDGVYLDREREADQWLRTIAQVVEVRTRYGLTDADDLGIERLPSLHGSHQPRDLRVS